MMSFQFWPAAILGLTLYLLAAIGALGIVVHLVAAILRLL
jgi:hypothetical protein